MAGRAKVNERMLTDEYCIATELYSNCGVLSLLCTVEYVLNAHGWRPLAFCPIGDWVLKSVLSACMM